MFSHAMVHRRHFQKAFNWRCQGASDWPRSPSRAFRRSVRLLVVIQRIAAAPTQLHRHISVEPSPSAWTHAVAVLRDLREVRLAARLPIDTCLDHDRAVPPIPPRTLCLREPREQRLRHLNTLAAMTAQALSIVSASDVRGTQQEPPEAPQVAHVSLDARVALSMKPRGLHESSNEFPQLTSGEYGRPRLWPRPKPRLCVAVHAAARGSAAWRCTACRTARRASSGEGLSRKELLARCESSGRSCHPRDAMMKGW